VKVEIWSDVACPWCYIGKRRFEAALARFEHRDEVDVRWRSFELDPSAPPVRDQPYAERLAAKYGTTLAQAEDTIDTMIGAGAAHGVVLRFDKARPANTFDAHRLLHFAAEHGTQHDLKERLFRSTFTKGASTSDIEILVALAADAGLDPDDARAVLAGDAYAEDVRADERRAMMWATLARVSTLLARVGLAMSGSGPWPGSRGTASQPACDPVANRPCS
jgi:predicted DsbA family dithiol-disulfide isomerase